MRLCVSVPVSLRRAWKYSMCRKQTDQVFPQPQQMMADERKMVEEAYAGDIIGIFDPGIFSIGDTLTTAKDKFQFEGIPTFAPEHFCTCTSDRLHEAQAVCKGVTQIAQEGAIQIFQEYKGGMEEIIVGVVGVLQFDVPGSVWRTSIMWRSVWRIFHMNISAGSRTRRKWMWMR